MKKLLLAIVLLVTALAAKASYVQEKNKSIVSLDQEECKKQFAIYQAELAQYEAEKARYQLKRARLNDAQEELSARQADYTAGLAQYEADLEKLRLDGTQLRIDEDHYSARFAAEYMPRGT